MKRLLLLCPLLLLLPARTLYGQETVFGPKTYVRTTAATNSYTDQFAFADRHRECRIEVLNGDEGGLHRVSSARITLNGTRLFGPSDFNQNVDSLNTIVELEASNTLAVEVGGMPDSWISIEITHLFYEEVPGWRMPEIAVREVKVTPERAAPGDTVTMSVTVASAGTADSPPAVLSILLDDSEIASRQVDPMPPPGTREFAATWTAGGAGRHVVRAQLNVADGQFDGSSENNVRIALARVSGETDPAPELEFRDIDFAGLRLNPGSPASVPVRFHNPGFVSLNYLLMRCFVDDELIYVEPIEGLSPGEDRELVVPWENVTPGEHVFRVVAYSRGGDDVGPQALFTATWAVVVASPTFLYSDPLKDKWISVGPRILDNGWTGRMRSIAFDPKDPDLLYAGALGMDGGIPAATGVWKSDDAGGKWTPIGDKLPQMMVGSLAVDPKNSKIIYVGGPDGIFKTTDGGTTWWYFAGPDVAKHVGRLFVRYASTGDVMIYAGASTGVLRYKSSNPLAPYSDSSDWDNIRKGEIGELVVHPTNASILWAFVRNDGLYRTTIGENAMPETSSGDHDWTELTAGLPTLSGKEVKLDVHKLYPSLVYAGVTKPQTGLSFGIYRSSDGGSNFTTLKTYAKGALDDDKSCPIYNPYIRIVPKAIDNNNVLQEIIYFGGNCLYQLVNYKSYGLGVAPQGGTYMVSGYYVKQQAGVDLKALEFYPTAPYSGTTYYSLGDQGVFKCFINTTPKQATLSGKKYGQSGDACFPRNNNLRVTEFYDFDVSKTNSKLILGGTQDTGTVLYSGDATSKWKMVKGGDGWYSLIHPTDDQIMYAQHQSLDSTLRSGDGGATWPLGLIGAPTGYGDLGFIALPPWGADNPVATPATSVLYVLVYLPFPFNSLFAYPVAPSGSISGNIVQAAYSKDLTGWFIGTDKGRVYYAAKDSFDFELVFSHPWSAGVLDLTVSPKEPSRLYLIFNVGGSETERIYTIEVDTTTPADSVAEDITDGFPKNVAAYTIIGDPWEEYRAYVGTDHGVRSWLPFGGGNVSNWKSYNDGLPLTTVLDLVVAPDKSLLAATKGRGAWRVITGP